MQIVTKYCLSFPTAYFIFETGLIM